MNEKISVIVAVYNTEKYLKKCIESLLSQSYENMEIIIVEDYSKDNSKQVLGSIFIPVLLGTLYKIMGMSIFSAIAL